MKLFLKSSLCLLLLTLCFPLNSQAQSPPIEPSILSRSDVPFSVRWWNPRLPNQNSESTETDPLLVYNSNADLNGGDINDMADLFYANRYLWNYRDLDNNGDEPNPSFPDFAANHTTPRSTQYTMPVFIEDFTGTLEELEAMTATNLCRRPLRGDFEIDNGWIFHRPDYSSEYFLDYQIAKVTPLVEDGNISFQQDLAGANETAVIYGGSFGESSMTKFNQWINDPQNNFPSYLKLILDNYYDTNDDNISEDTFQFFVIDNLQTLPGSVTLPLESQYNTNNGGLDQYDKDCNCVFKDIYIATKLEAEDVNSTVNNISKIKYYFREFQKDMTLMYYEQLHAAIDGFIDDKFPGRTGTYSANNTERNGWLAPAFDFWISELYPRDNEVGLVYDVFELARFGRSAFYEFDDSLGDVTSAITLARNENHIETHKTSIALGYASGLTMIAPWDVYIPPINGNRQPRFYGNSDDYKLLLSFIRSNESLFDSYNTIEEHNHSFLTYYDEVWLADVYSQDSNRYVIQLLRKKIPNNISAGSIININGIEYKTAVNTTNGSIYISTTGSPPDGLGSLSIGSLIGKPIYYLDLKNDDGTFTRYFDDSYRSQRSVNTPDVDITTGFVTTADDLIYQGRRTIYWTDQGSLDIPVGSVVGINGTEYITTVATGVGNIYLPSGSNVEVGDPIWYIKNPNGDIIYPTMERPFAITYRNQDNYGTTGVVETVSQTIARPFRTQIRWTETDFNGQGLAIPKGSKVLINDVEYTTSGDTTVGYIYLASDEFLPENTIKPDDKIWYIKDPEGRIIYPVKQYENGVMHVINLKDQSTKVAVKVKDDMFTEVFTEEFSPLPSVTSTTHSNDGDYDVYVIDQLDKWAILKQDLSSNRLAFTTENDDVLIYPNPNDGTFTVKLQDNYKDIKIHMYNNVGLLVYKNLDATTVTHVSMSGLSTGLYIVQIETRDETITKKIIIK